MIQGNASEKDQRSEKSLTGHINKLQGWGMNSIEWEAPKFNIKEDFGAQETFKFTKEPIPKLLDREGPVIP